MRCGSGGVADVVHYVSYAFGILLVLISASFGFVMGLMISCCVTVCRSLYIFAHCVDTINRAHKTKIALCLGVGLLVGVIVGFPTSWDLVSRRSDSRGASEDMEYQQPSSRELFHLIGLRY